MAPATEQFNGVGRRKTSTARVYLRPGKGEFKINGRSFEGHFGKRDRGELVRQNAYRDPHKQQGRPYLRRENEPLPHRLQVTRRARSGKTFDTLPRR